MTTTESTLSGGWESEREYMYTTTYVEKLSEEF